jgi:hypothetical protein
MVIFRVSLFFLPLIGIMVLIWTSWHRKHPSIKRSIFKFIGAILIVSVIGCMLGARIGMEVYCRFTESNLCGIGGLFLGGIGGLYLGAIGVCWKWYLSGESS